ncbi:MAG TPA: efflux RND transporter periplasmic adaptor subunit [Bacteroidetes bacterium]|nr:efflux RND transporter periplasmic adaptor subunit [Bacteroidota bacterium]
MKKLIITLAALMLFFGCSNHESPEAMRNQLSKLKEQQLQLNHAIRELEKKLSSVEKDSKYNGQTPVQVKTLNYEVFQHYFLANGTVELQDEAFISPETNGQVETILAKKGERVKRGDVLIRLNTDILENSIAEVKLGLELATKVYEKQSELWEQGIGSELQYLEAKNGKESLEQKLKTLQSQLAMSIIKAPFNGIIDDIMIKEGELASPGKPIIYLMNLDTIKITADVSESLLPKINVGDTVDVLFPTYKDLSYSAPINRIGNAIDSKTRTIKIEVLMPNVKGLIKPNQMASLNIKDFESTKAIVVPSLIVKQDSKGEFLFIESKNEEGMSIAQKVYVESGLSYNDKTMIISGLKAGQNAITAGFNQVGNGSLIEIRQ